MYENLSMRIPTVKLRRKADGKIIKVNAIDYATDLGKENFKGYELVGERGAPEPKETVVVTTAAGPTRVGVEEVIVANTGMHETPGYKAVKRGRGRPRKIDRPDQVDR